MNNHTHSETNNTITISVSQAALDDLISFEYDVELVLTALPLLARLEYPLPSPLERVLVLYGGDRVAELSLDHRPLECGFVAFTRELVCF